MSDKTPAVPPFSMVGDAEGPVCVDGVCKVPGPANAPALADDAPS